MAKSFTSAKELREWISKAEADYKAAIALNRRRKEPLPDIVCFHCQQCAEKYFKAYMVAHRVHPPRIHDLEDLLKLCAVHDASLAKQLALARALDSYSVDVRYPGFFASVAQAKEAVTTMLRLRTIMRRQLGLK